MDLLKMNLLQGSVFKQAKYLVSTPQRSQPVIFISETGTVSREILPMYTGYMTASNLKMTWLVLHPLKLSVRHNGVIKDDQVLLITERSYIPQDPFKRLSEEDKAKITPLEAVAELRHNAVLNDISEESEDARSRMMQGVVNGSFIIMGLIVVFKLIVFWAGG